MTDKSLEEWSTDQVIEWLGDTNGALKTKYGDTWKEEGVDGAMLTMLDDETLQNDLGVASKLHRKRILLAVEQLKSSKRIKTEHPTTVDVKVEENAAAVTTEPAVEPKKEDETKHDDAPKEAKEGDPVTEDTEEAVAPLDEEGDVKEKDAEAAVPEETSSKEIEICFSFDTTGSMYACLGQVRRKLSELVERLLRDVPHMKIAVIAHGDYGDEGETYLMKKVNFSCDKDILVNWVNDVGSTHGYDGDEAYEYVLREARSLAWSPTCVRRSLVMIGDSNPHTTKNNKYNIDWREQCRELAKMDVRVHGVHALGYSFSRNFYQELAQITGGMYLELNQFNSIRDLILGVAMAEVDDDTYLLSKLEEEVRKEGRMTRSMRRVFDRLHRRGSTAGAVAPEGLKTVNEGRFQVMDIDEKVAIKVFAESQGLIFKAGKGFYEFTKPEKISLKKEIVLQAKETGDFFTGDPAREMLGITAATANKKIKPTDFEKYRVFVQSSSYNRNLMGGTKFLYEVDADR